MILSSMWRQEKRRKAMNDLIKDPNFIKFHKEESIFQAVYNWFKNLKTPKWLVDLLQFIQDTILIPSLKMIGEQALNDLRVLIVEAAKEDWTGREKFEWVRERWLKAWSFENITDHAINLVIEHIVSEMKEKEYIA